MTCIQVISDPFKVINESTEVTNDPHEIKNIQVVFHASSSYSTPLK